jgi:hypothetical protein
MVPEAIDQVNGSSLFNPRAQVAGLKNSDNSWNFAPVP